MAFTPLTGQTAGGFQALSPKLGKQDAKTLRVQSFMQANELTPLITYVNDDGTVGFGIITSDLSTNIGSPFNADGLDIFAPNGTPFRSPVDGVVVEVFTDGKPADGSNGGFGNQIIIEAKDGSLIQISHLKEDSIDLNVGDTVKKTEKIAQVGNTGTVLNSRGATVSPGDLSQGNHVDWEVERDGVNLDIREIKQEFEDGIGENTKKLFNNPKNQLSLERHFEAIQQVDSDFSKEFDRGAMRGVGDKFKEGFVTIGNIPGNVKDFIAEAGVGVFTDPIETIGGKLNFFKPIGEFMGATGFDLVNATIKDIKALPAVVTMMSDTLDGRGSSAEIVRQVEGAGEITKDAVINVGNLIPAIVPQFAAGVLEELEKTEGQGLGAGEARGRALAAGAQRATVIGLANKFLFKRGGVTKEVKQAREAGVAEKDIRRLSRQTDIPKQELKNLLEQQKKSVIEPLEGSALDLAGKDLQAFLNESKALEAKIGGQIGGELKTLKFQRQNIDMTPFRNEFIKNAKDLNIKLDKNGRIIKDSFIDSKLTATADQTLIKELDQFVNRSNIKPSDLEAFQSRIGDKLFRAKKPGQELITQAKRPAEIQRVLADETISGLSPTLKQFKADFSQLRGVRDALKKAAGDEGLKGARLLKRLFSTSAPEANAILGNVENIAKQFQIKSAQNIRSLAEKAKALETIIGEPPAAIQGTRGLLGRGTELGKAAAISQVSPLAGRSRAIGAIVPSRTARATIGLQGKQAAAAEGLLSRSAKAAPLRFDPKSVTERILNKFIPEKATGPSLAAPEPGILGRVKQGFVPEFTQRPAAIGAQFGTAGAIARPEAPTPARIGAAPTQGKSLADVLAEASGKVKKAGGLLQRTFFNR